MKAIYLKKRNASFLRKKVILGYIALVQISKDVKVRNFIQQPTNLEDVSFRTRDWNNLYVMTGHSVEYRKAIDRVRGTSGGSCDRHGASSLANIRQRRS